MKIERKDNTIFFYMSMALACAGMSAAFVPVYSGSNLFVLAVCFTIPFLVGCLIKSKGILHRADFIIILLAMMPVIQTILKLIYYENVLLSGPIVFVSGFILIIAVLFNRDFEFSFRPYLAINVAGMILLSAGVFIYSHNTWGVVAIGTVNPQTIGAWAMVYAIGTMLSLDYYIYKAKHRWILGLLEIVVVGLMLYYIWITDSRFAMLTVIAVLVCRRLPLLRFINCKLFRAILGFTPTLLLIVLLAIYVISGNEWLNGRERLWLSYLQDIMQSPIVGVAYNTFDANSFYSHNMVVDGLVLAGVPATMMFQLCLSYVFVKKVPCFNHCASSRIKYSAFISFLLILVASSVEGCFFGVGAGGILFFSVAPLFIAVTSRDLES